MQRLLEWGCWPRRWCCGGAPLRPGFQPGSPGVDSMPVHKTRKPLDHTALQEMTIHRGSIGRWEFSGRNRGGPPPVKFPSPLMGSGDLDIEGSDMCSGIRRALEHGLRQVKVIYLQSRFSLRLLKLYQTCDLTDITAVCTISGGSTRTGSASAASPRMRSPGCHRSPQTSTSLPTSAESWVLPVRTTRTSFTLVAAGSVKDDLFSLCINEEEKTSNGTLTLGGIGEPCRRPMQWGPTRLGFYEALDGILAGNISLKGPIRQLFWTQAPISSSRRSLTHKA